MEWIRFHVFFKISLIGRSGLLSFSPNKDKKKKIVQGIKPLDYFLFLIFIRAET